MLELKNITKTYLSGDTRVDALRDVSVNFRKNEFVAILGQSGSGKTTLLNIIGGLDRYDDGDLIINGRSTKEYRDKDWDSYRNHSIGFVFQSYNLIPHQTVLSNVELALTLSGVSKAERRARAKAVLERVGLGDQLRKKPNQMSGGQMQRVAIARALVNDPDILLADEPTGALDSETSVQIMDLISEIAKDRLVIMVTHNPELANEYANRIISLHDGRITDDSNAYDGSEETAQLKSEQPQRSKKQKKTEKTSMSAFTSFSLSFNNLLTKKTRTLLTSFAGSIGIIGIALILSLSSGMRAYIASIEQDALSYYPLTIESQAVDLSGLMDAFDTGAKDAQELGHGRDKIYENTIMSGLIKTMSAQVSNNDLRRFKQYIESNSEFSALTSAVQYSYSLQLQIFKHDTSAGVTKILPNEMMSTMIEQNSAGFGGASTAMTNQFTSTMSLWQEMIDNKELLSSQYDIVAGEWPDSYDEVVLVVDKNNEITDVVLYALGVGDTDAIQELMSQAMSGMAAGNGDDDRSTTAAPEEAEQQSYEYDDFLNLKFKLVLNTDYYQKQDGKWVDMSGDEDYMTKLVDSSPDIKISAIVRPADGVTATSITGAIGYTHALTEYVVNHVNNSEIAKEQLAHPETDVISGLPFEPLDGEDDAQPSADKAQEPTTAAVPTTAPAASPAASPAAAFVKPTVSPLGASDGTLTAAPMSESFTMPNVENVMSQQEVIDYINSHYSGDESERMTRLVELMLKDLRTTSERKELVALLDGMLAGQTIPGVGSVSGSQAYSYINMMDKDTKLKFLTAIITSTPPTSQPGTVPSGGSENPAVSEPVTEPEPEVNPYSESTYEDNLATLGIVSLDNPSRINIYPLDFESKELIQAFIDEYNAKQTNEGHEEYVIGYTDLIGMIMSSVTSIINIVTYALIAFVAISLVVSSIMIGVITYISVLERTKEIGVLRSIGASKHDISSVFNCETLIVGLVSGLIGIGVTMLLNIPINIIIKHLTHISNLSVLPFYGAIALVIISVLLTVFAGLIPSRLAAKKDPVVALRTE